jgi:hypothetical protein
VKCVNAIHSSSLPDGTYGGSAGGFVVESADANFYYSCDTALTLDMKLISETTKLKFAVLCIGGTLTMTLMTPSVPLTFSNVKTSWACITIPSRSSKLIMPLPKKNSARRD